MPNPVVAIRYLINESTVERNELMVEEAIFKPRRERGVMKRINDWLQTGIPNEPHGSVHPAPIESTRAFLDSVPGNGISEFTDPGLEQKGQVFTPLLDMPSGSEDVLPGSENICALKPS
jgi:hypothetical protein